MANRQPENIGEVIFKSFGQGLQALSGILETDRQNKLQDLQLQMNMRVQEARLEKLRVSTVLNQEALDLAHETPEETGQRKAAIALAETRDLLEGALLQRTGQPTIAPFASAIGGLQQTAEDIGMDFTVPTPTGAFEFGGAEPLDRFGVAADLGLVPTGITGEGDVTFGRPLREPAGVSKTERESTERGLLNTVYDRFRAVNPEAFKKLKDDKGKLISDEIKLQTLAQSDEFVTKTPIEGTGFDLPFIGQTFGEETRQVDPELQQAINELRAFREGRSDDQVARQTVKTPTPRQDAIGWLSQASEDWASAPQDEKDRATQRLIDFQVSKGRLPESIEELMAWLQ
jgi:hypothetical protein